MAMITFALAPQKSKIMFAARLCREASLVQQTCGFKHRLDLRPAGLVTWATHTRTRIRMSQPTYPELAGRKAIVTGAATGIGRAIAAALSRQSVQVALCDLDADAAKRAATDIGQRAVGVKIDVRSRASVEAAFRRVEDTLGGYD